MMTREQAIESLSFKDVTSSMIKKVAYDDVSLEGSLYVIYANDSMYRFDDVEIERYQEMMEADSAGKYFNANIKGAYPTYLWDEATQAWELRS